MIAKRIRAGRKQRRSSRATGQLAMALISYVVSARAVALETLTSINSLTAYVADAVHIDRDVGGHEKVREVGRRNVSSGTFTDLQADIAAVAMQAAAADPLEHIVLSWREDEFPTPSQVEQAVDIVLDDLGARDLQCIWAVHHNTRHLHVHVVINRVSPTTHRLRELGEGWEIDRLHQSLAKIEARQGWQSEAGGIYREDPHGVLRRRDNGRLPPRKGADHAGERAERARANKAEPKLLALRQIFAGAESWPELHRALAEVGVSYIRKGSGAILTKLECRPIKPSSIHADCSHSMMERRLGPFLPTPQIPTPDLDRAKALEAIEAQLVLVDETRAVTLRLLEQQRLATTRAATERISRHEVRELIAASIAAESHAASLAATAELNAETRRLRVLRRQIRSVNLATAELPTLFLAGDAEQRGPVPVPGYAAQAIKGATAYYRVDGILAFVDRRTHVSARSTDDADLIAGMRLAAARFGSIRVVATPEIEARCLRLAAAEGIMAISARAPAMWTDTWSEPLLSVPRTPRDDKSWTPVSDVRSKAPPIKRSVAPSAPSMPVRLAAGMPYVSDVAGTPEASLPLVNRDKSDDSVPAVVETSIQTADVTAVKVTAPSIVVTGKSTVTRVSQPPSTPPLPLTNAKTTPPEAIDRDDNATLLRRLWQLHVEASIVAAYLKLNKPSGMSSVRSSDIGRGRLIERSHISSPPQQFRRGGLEL